MHLFNKNIHLTCQLINKGAVKYHIIRRIFSKSEIGHSYMPRQCQGVYLFKKTTLSPSLLIISPLEIKSGIFIACFISINPSMICSCSWTGSSYHFFLKDKKLDSALLYICSWRHVYTYIFMPEFIALWHQVYTCTQDHRLLTYVRAAPADRELGGGKASCQPRTAPMHLVLQRGWVGHKDAPLQG